jgi:hypothetical protein
MVIRIPVSLSFFEAIYFPKWRPETDKMHMMNRVSLSQLCDANE